MAPGFFHSSSFYSATTAAVVTDPFILPFRLNHLRGKGDTTDAAADILFEIAVGTLADDVAEAEIADTVAGGTQSHTVEQISVAVDIEDDLLLPVALDADRKWGVFAL